MGIEHNDERGLRRDENKIRVSHLVALAAGHLNFVWLEWHGPVKLSNRLNNHVNIMPRMGTMVKKPSPGRGFDFRPISAIIQMAQFKAMTEESIDALRAERDRLVGALAERSSQLEAISREFEQFTQTLSHDLRAPLRAVEGFAQILLEDYAGKLDDEGKRYLDTLASGARKASALIEDLHGYSRLSRRPFQPAIVNMLRLAGQKANALKAEATTAKFHIDELPEAWGDPDLLGAILEHLLRNAVKFAGRQERPSIEISGWSKDGNTVYAVRDNGIGFDPKYAGRLFGVFVRLHAESDFEGRGIGLATVQRLVHRHGGKVWAEGKVNAGATFFFSLPVRPL
jgi:light-regulated signal transduction histidine kinase (bacteriophytochrome)